MSDIAPYLPSILIALGTVTLTLMSPGPNILAVIGTAMGAGRKFGVALALGVASGTFLWSVIAVTGMTAIITAYASILIVIKIVGGLYLLWLGIKCLRSAFTKKTINTTDLGASANVRTYYFRGLTVQMTNPKAALALTAIVSIGIQPTTPVMVSIILVAGISLLSLIAHLLYAYTFSTQPVVDAYLKCRRAIDAALGSFFCFAGFKLLTDKA